MAFRRLGVMNHKCNSIIFSEPWMAILISVEPLENNCLWTEWFLKCFFLNVYMWTCENSCLLSGVNSHYLKLYLWFMNGKIYSTWTRWRKCSVNLWPDMIDWYIVIATKNNCNSSWSDHDRLWYITLATKKDCNSSWSDHDRLWYITIMVQGHPLSLHDHDQTENYHAHSWSLVIDWQIIFISIVNADGPMQWLCHMYIYIHESVWMWIYKYIVLFMI